MEQQWLLVKTLTDNFIETILEKWAIILNCKDRILESNIFCAVTFDV